MKLGIGIMLIITKNRYLNFFITFRKIERTLNDENIDKQILLAQIYNIHLQLDVGTYFLFLW